MAIKEYFRSRNKIIRFGFVKIFVAFCILIMGASFLWYGMVWYRFLTIPMLSVGNTTVIVTPGLKLHRLAEQLKQRSILSHPQLFILLAYLFHEENKIRIGEFYIDNHTTPYRLLDNMVKGKAVMRKVILVEGSNFEQIRQKLVSAPGLQPTLSKYTNEQVMAMLGQPLQHPEGRFFPDTYVYTWGNKDILILHQAYQRMQNFLTQQWLQRQEGLPYKNKYEALIVASLIESEVKLAGERPRVAAVIIQRLQKNMRLQIDPTVLYGVGKNLNAKITLQDLQAENLYNTYRHYGLPPTPINLPSVFSIEAALHPSKESSLYYVARGDGSNEFSVTYAQHLLAIERYRKSPPLWELFVRPPLLCSIRRHGGS